MNGPQCKMNFKELILIFHSGLAARNLASGIVEFKDNSLSILTSSIFSLDKIDKNYVNESIQNAEKELSDELLSQKINSQFLYV